MNSIVRELANDVHRATENAILEQLNDFVSRGLIVIESSIPVLVQEVSNNKIVVRQQVQLTLKDKEYIEKLEKENQNLKEILAKMKEVFPGVEK